MAKFCNNLTEKNSPIINDLRKKATSRDGFKVQ